MHIDVLTLFPAMFQGPLTESILQRASTVVPHGGTMVDRQEEKPIQIHLHDLREWGIGTHRQVDDAPYGGGAGMVMRVDVVAKAIEDVVATTDNDELLAMSDKCPHSQSSKLKAQSHSHCILLSAKGKRLTQERVEELAKLPRLLLLCGHYEGVDERIIEGGWIDEEISIGDYVLTGGELPAMVLIDAVARQIPGVLGKEESAAEESFSAALDRKREYPHYTRPEEFRGLKVPPILLSGNHAEIAGWRKRMTNDEFRMTK